MATEDLQLQRTDDGQWAVVRDGETVSVHPNQSGAESERVRIAQAELAGDDDAPEGYRPEEGPNPDNVGS